MSSALDHAQVVEDYLKFELEASHILGPFPSNNLLCPTNISPIGIIPKQHQQNEWRLIVDMSSPDGTSINDGITPSLTSLVYSYPGCNLKKKTWTLVAELS